MILSSGEGLLIWNSLKFCHVVELTIYDKILYYTKLTALAVDKIKVTQKLKFVMGQVENIVGKGENAGYQHFLLFP